MYKLNLVGSPKNVSLGGGKKSIGRERAKNNFTFWKKKKILNDQLWNQNISK